MSTAPDIAALDNRLNQMILSGKIMKAFEQFYADDVIMRENSEPPVKGKDANRQRELAFLDSVETFHGAEFLAGATGDEVSMGEWVLDITFKGGQRVSLQQVSVRRWRDGQVVSERFYYNSN